ncbi:MAG: energy-coupling factor transporter transmembrane protein EcfT [Treponema sp.]|nr:energy-coupling factor transporter transmembrane protein EcfT [Treponema sp.]
MKISKITPWAYRKGFTVLHRLGAGVKLVLLLSLSLAVFLPRGQVQSIAALAVIALALTVLSFVAGIGPRALLRGSGSLVFLFLGVFLLRGVEFAPFGLNTEGLWVSALFCLRLCVAFAAGSLLFAVATPGEIRKAFSRMEAALRLEKLKIGLGLSLMLGFLPRFFEIWEDVNLAWKSRAGRKSLFRLVIVIPLVVERMMVKAAETATALESRGAAE